MLAKGYARRTLVVAAAASFFAFFSRAAWAFSNAIAAREKKAKKAAAAAAIKVRQAQPVASMQVSFGGKECNSLISLDIHIAFSQPDSVKPGRSV